MPRAPLPRARIAILSATAIAWVIALGCLFVSIAQSQNVTICMDDEKLVARMREIMLDGVDQALREHTMHLFDVWSRDLKDQPGRASVGLNNGLRAYVLSRERIAAWNPPRCK